MKTIEYRRIPLAHNYSQYMAVSDPAEFLALEGNNVVFNEKAERVGLN
jgi:hypothetical protein